jgi:hypothetical protein
MSRRYTPSVLRQRAQVPVESSCPLKRAMAHREVAPYVTPRAINPQAVNEIGKGDRILAEAYKQLLNPFYVPEQANAPSASAPMTKSDSVLRAAFASVGAGMRAVQARVNVPQPRQREAAHQQPGFIAVPVSAEARAAYERQRLADEQGEQ